jgi:hypothetical protein
MTATYTGHATGHASAVQLHSCDSAYLHFRIIMVCHSGPSGKLLWHATRDGKTIIAARRHDAALAAAVGLLTGA